MNDQSSKKITFNKSTLWNLKAELLKKQEEVLEKKRLPQNNVENFKPPPAKSQSSDKDKVTFKEKLTQAGPDVQEIEACRKSKAALERKSELYEHLSDAAGNSELAGRFLVDFNTKKQQEQDSKIQEPDSPPVETPVEEDDSEWTEFTDCLGRTRKCLKTDLDLYMQKDEDLMKAITKDLPKEDSPVIEKPVSEKPFLVQKTNDYLQSLREKWEVKEKELLAKDKDIHYQDVLFDEARMHGVAYYSFSTKDGEREKQMEELKRRREQTLRAQKVAEGERKQREEMMASRVAAARARMRARAGLPPETEEKEKEKDFTACLLEFLNQQKEEADAKAKEKEKKIREEKEIERQKLRETYVREWDVGKDGVPGTVKPFREMTQEEYVEQQRSKRIDEFAPPKATSSQKSKHSFDDKGRLKDSNEPLSWADVRPRQNTPPPPLIGDITEQKGLFFSTQKKRESDMKYKNFVKSEETIEPTPIVNEISEDDDVRISNSSGNSTEIAPPPTYDYYGPVSKRSKASKPFDSDIREAYAQGTKSLEPKASNRKLPKHYDFTFD